jgi:hypothetical protein
MIVTCESNPTEMEALRARCAGCADIDASRWAVLGHLTVGQAVALPITEETGGELRLFTIAPRITPHVRHRVKYVDVPVSSHRAFVFNANGQPGHKIRTLRQFVSELEHAPLAQLGEYIRRGDFSRWIGDVFGDRALAAELKALEERHRSGSRGETLVEMAGPSAAGTTSPKTKSRRWSLELFRSAAGNSASAPSGLQITGNDGPQCAARA